MRKGKNRRGEPGRPAAARVLKVSRAGEWLAADEFCEACSQVVDQHVDLRIDLEGVDHLDASALQILLALRVKQQQNGCQLLLTGPSSSLLRWFEFAGAKELFSFAPAC